MTYTNITPVGLTGSAKTPGNFVLSNLTLAGTDSMVTSGAGSAKTYKYTVPTDKVFNWHRTNVLIIDTSIDGSKFGGVTSTTSGVQFNVVDSDETVLLNFTDSLESAGIKNNGEFGLLAGVDVNILSGTPNDTALVRWSIDKAGAPVKLTAGQYIACTVRDDLTGLIRYHTQVQGILNDA